MPERVMLYPELRYMGSKKRLLPWLHGVLSTLDFETALDPFSGTGSVGYLMKAMGRQVVASDFLNFSQVVARATIENSDTRLDDSTVDDLIHGGGDGRSFIEDTFSGVFYTVDDLRFLDRLSCNIRLLPNPHAQSLAFAALFRSCLKRQPRGVFTVSGDLSKYDDGRRDLRLSLEDHFREQVSVYNDAVFDNGRKNLAYKSDVFDIDVKDIDLVYLDPPYVPRSDDNCYVKRYHFLEGLSAYWEDMPIKETTKVKKIEKKYTPFSYRRTAITAFDDMFSKFSQSQIVLSYSSNGYPGLEDLVSMMGKYKKRVEVFQRQHRYHFGNHAQAVRSSVLEYLIVGR